MSEYRIFQAQILAKDPVTPRQYSVVEIPNGQKLVGVQLPNALKDQSAPLLGSIVLVLQLDAYRSYILMVLREPYTFLSTNDQYRGFIPSVGNAAQDIHNHANPIQDGEIYMEATGPSSPTGQGIPGFGAHLYLGNNGTAQIESGSTGERLVVGGTGSDDDHEVVLSADNGYFESNTGTNNIQSTFNFTTNSVTGLTEGLQIATQLSVPTGLTTVETPICELTMDTIGNITLRNTAFGTPLSLCSLSMTPVGDISLSSNISGIPGASLTLDSSGEISLFNNFASIDLVGPTISLNNGTPIQGVARVGDLVSSNAATDPLFWALIAALTTFFQQIAALSVIPGAPPNNAVTNAVLGAFGLQALSTISNAAGSGPAFPLSQTSVILTGSTTVSAGD
jgi:hypothetical protein